MSEEKKTVAEEKEESFISSIEYSKDSKEQTEYALPTDTILKDRYRIIGCIGIGGFGITYLCEDLKDVKNVAVKEYFPSEWVEREESYVSLKKSSFRNAFRYGLQSFQNEINITAKFAKTPGIVTIYDAFKENETLYMVMEYIKGTSIGKIMKQRKGQAFSMQEAMELLDPVFDNLNLIHQRGFIHSDISPANLILEDDGQMKIIDFGAAKDMRRAGISLQSAFLKPDYAAPEQYQSAKSGKAKGEGPWTDIYALGATIYYMLTGCKPRNCISRLSDTDNEIFTDISNEEEYVWLPVIKKATALDRSKRYMRTPDMKEALRNLLS